MLSSLARALRINGSLTRLDISENRIGDDGLKNLSEAVQMNVHSSLKAFLIAKINLSDIGGQSLSDLLISASDLRELDFAGNE